MRTTAFCAACASCAPIMTAIFHVRFSPGFKIAPTHVNTIHASPSIVETTQAGNCKKKWGLMRPGPSPLDSQAHW